MKNTEKHPLVGTVFVSSEFCGRPVHSTVESIHEDEASGFWLALCRDEKGHAHHIRKGSKAAVEREIKSRIEPLDIKWLKARAELLNLSEVARLSGVARTRIADALRGRAMLSGEDFGAIKKVIAKLA